MRLLRARSSAELKKVASGSATQGLWLGTEKCDLRKSAKSKADSLGEEQLGKLGWEEEEPTTERRREYTN